MRGIYVSLLIVVLLVSSGGVAAESNETKHYTHPIGVEYSVRFIEETERITVTASNPTQRELPASFHVEMDTWYSKREAFELSPGEERVFAFDLTEGVDFMRDDHSVKFIGGPESLHFNFTKEIDPISTNEYPTPEITDISLVTGSYQNGQRTLIDVTGYNPSGRSMTLVIRAHTLETTGFYGLIQFSPHSSSNETIILNEKPGELVAGEVRMYTGNFSAGDGALDQVEIKGRSGEETRWSHEEYETVVAPWEDENDHYVYENESVHREKIGAPESVRESPVAWLAGAVLLLVGYTRVRRYLG